MAECSEIEAGGEVRTIKDPTARKALVYSTDETDTGKKWVDGKPIYRKVYNGSYSQGLILATNVNNLVSISGCAGSTTEKTAFPFSSQYAYATVQVNSAHSIVAYTNTNYASALIVLEYTKTTD